MAHLYVLTSQEVMRGRAKRPTPVGTVVVLYQVGLHGMACGAVCITDKPARPTRASC